MSTTSPTRKAKRDRLARFKRMQAKRKMVMVPCDPQMFSEILIKGTVDGVTASGLPADVVPMGWQYDPRQMALLFIYGHESFKPVKVGHDLPVMEVKFTRKEKEAEQAAA